MTRNFIEVAGLSQVINFGCNKVRFYSTVNEGDKVRARGTLLQARKRGSMIQLLSKISVEVDGSKTEFLNFLTYFTSESLVCSVLPPPSPTPL